MREERGLHRGEEVQVILDNFESHRLASLRGVGKVHLVYLLVQASWSNRVELLFRDLKGDVLKGRAFGGVRELSRAVYRYARW